MITTDIAIIGSGPVGLFAIFETGQLSEIYPKKPIYDIPGFPTIQAQELIDNLLKQAEPFKPTFTFGERVESLNKIGEKDFIITTHLGTKINAQVVVIAGGLGCFEPRKPQVIGLNDFENGKGVSYMVLDPEKYRNKKVVLAGGGDSALDWAIHLSDIASELTLVHRSESFRGSPHSVNQVLKIAKENKIKVLLNSTLKEVQGKKMLENVVVLNTKTNETQNIDVDYLIPLFGLSPKLGPIADWELSIDKNAIEVNIEDYSTNVPGIYAIGDINTYQNKLKLILCGFHEAAIMAHSAYKYIHPEAKYTMKYTTVSGVNTF
jgi:thioredoxin reductase (NADPH)